MLKVLRKTAKEYLEAHGAIQVGPVLVVVKHWTFEERTVPYLALTVGGKPIGRGLFRSNSVVEFTTTHDSPNAHALVSYAASAIGDDVPVIQTEGNMADIVQGFLSDWHLSVQATEQVAPEMPPRVRKAKTKAKEGDPK